MSLTQAPRGCSLGSDATALIKAMKLVAAEMDQIKVITVHTNKDLPLFSPAIQSRSQYDARDGPDQGSHPCGAGANLKERERKVAVWASLRPATCLFARRPQSGARAGW